MKIFFKECVATFAVLTVLCFSAQNTFPSLRSKSESRYAFNIATNPSLIHEISPNVAKDEYFTSKMSEYYDQSTGNNAISYISFRNRGHEMDFSKNMSIISVARLCSYYRIISNISENNAIFDEVIDSYANDTVQKLMYKEMATVDNEDFMNKVATREEALYIIYNILLMPIDDVLAEPRDKNFDLIHIYTDANELSEWGLECLKLLHINDYVYGKGSKIRPKEQADIEFCNVIASRFDPNDYADFSMALKYQALGLRRKLNDFGMKNMGILTLTGVFTPIVVAIKNIISEYNKRKKFFYQ